MELSVAVRGIKVGLRVEISAEALRPFPELQAGAAAARDTAGEPQGLDHSRLLEAVQQSLAQALSSVQQNLVVQACDALSGKIEGAVDGRR